MPSRRPSSWVCIVAVMIGLPLLYFMSFGPACWISSRVEQSGRSITLIFRPVAWIICHGPAWITTPIVAYGDWMVADATGLHVIEHPLQMFFE